MRKKILKTFSSRLLYFFLGLLLAFSIFAAKAAWNDRVRTGQPLTYTLWNDLIAHIEDLEARLAALASRIGAVEARPQNNFSNPTRYSAWGMNGNLSPATSAVHQLCILSGFGQGGGDAQSCDLVRNSDSTWTLTANAGDRFGNTCYMLCF